MPAKKPWMSKTLWINAIMVLSALFMPAVGAWVTAHGDYVTYIFAAVNVALRLATKGAIQLVDDSPKAA